MIVPFLASLVIGCAIREKAPDLEGREHATAEGFSLWWIEPTEAYETPEVLGAAVDAAFGEWVLLHSDLTRVYLKTVAVAYPIQAVPARHVKGDKWWRFYEGYTWYGKHIEFAVLGEFEDKYFTKRRLKGAGILLHEWEHALRGDFHPE